MANEVRIIVRTQNDARAGFEAAEKDAETFGDRTSASFRERFVQGLQRLAERAAEPLRQQGQVMGERLGDSTAQGFGRRLTDRIRRLGKDVEASSRRAGEDIGDTIGRSASERLTRDINGRLRDSRGRFVGGDDGRDGRNGAPSGGVDTDRSGNFFSRLIRGALGAGRDAAGKFTDAFTGGLSAFSQTIIGQIVSILAVGAAGAIAPVLLSAVSAAITSGIMLALGGGVIAAGIASAFKDPRIQAAAGELGDRLGKMFERFGEPFRGPLATFMEKFAGFLDSIQPDLDAIADTFAPVLEQLSTGVIAAMQNAWPGIAEAIKASAPFVETLAKRMPEIGEAIGEFFRVIAGQGDDANVFFNDLITVIIKLIGFVGRLIAAFTSWYANIRRIVTGARDLFVAFAGWLIGLFGRLLDAAYSAFSWVPGLGSRLANARAMFSRTREHIVGELNRIPRTRTVTITAVSQVGRAVGNALAQLGRIAATYAHGGVRGAFDGATSSGLTWVGEQGPELVQMAPGSRVHTAGDSARMWGSRSSGQFSPSAIRLIADRTTERGLVDVLMRILRAEVISAGGGNVQRALGTGSA